MEPIHDADDPLGRGPTHAEPSREAHVDVWPEEFHHNIITRCEYFWLRKRGTSKTYLVGNSVVTQNRHYSGYAVESGVTGVTGPEIRLEEKGVVKAGKVALERRRGTRNYFHVIPGTPGAELGAGLFTKTPATPPAQ
ncbi:MAG: hypothetical protein ACYC6Y_30140 [Thermoguttaceae bacterium]